MRRHERAPEPGAAPDSGDFVLFVEGPRDRDILRSWARQVVPRLAPRLAPASVILGGRQPARAVGHLRALRERGRSARGLCVLDRDTVAARSVDAASEVALELYTWERRHIESYLLVPDAIRRALRAPDHGGALARRLRQVLPASGDERALREIDAKRLLDRKGPVARAVGRPVDAGRIARTMRSEEIHPEVHALLGRLAEAFGLVRAAPELVTIRRALRPR